MAKISNLVAYPTVTPTLGDYVIGTDTTSSNATVNFTLSSIANIVPADTLEEVLTAGNTATNNIILTGNISVSGTYGDTSGDVGTAGQVLSSTGTGTNWVNNVDGSGTLNSLSKWTPDGNTLGDSNVTDNGTNVTITAAASAFEVRATGGSSFETIVEFNDTTRTDSILYVADVLHDGLNNAGGSGQILSSTVTGVQWIDQLPSGLSYQGVWNANTNSPALASGVGTPGHYYIVGTPGTTNLDGNNSWQNGDWAVFSSTNVWQEIDNQNIFSGSGTSNRMTKFTGTQSLGNSNISDDGTNIDVGVSTAVNLNFTNTGNVNVDGSVSTFRFNNTDVSFSPGVQLMDAGAGAGTAGQVLSSTGAEVQWIDTVDGSGTLNTIPKWTPDTDTLGNSNITDDGTLITLGGTNTTLSASGTLTATGYATMSLATVANDINISATGELKLDSASQVKINASNTTISISMYGPTDFEESAYFKKTIKDGGGGVGTAGQVLSSTGTAVDWVDTNPTNGQRTLSGSVLSAALLNIGAAPAQLVPAPGAGKIIVLDNLTLFNDYGTVAYTGVGGVSGAFYSTDLTSGGRVVSISTSFYTSTSDTIRNYRSTTGYSLTVNDSIVLGNTTSTNLTAGDGDFYFTVSYRILNATDMTVVMS